MIPPSDPGDPPPRLEGETLPKGLQSSGSFDPAEALARFGGDRALFAEMVQDFLDLLPRFLDDVRVAIPEGNLGLVEHIAHRVKGSVAYFADRAAVDAARQLEQAAKARDAAATQTAWEVFQPALQALAQSLAPFAHVS